MEKLETVIGLEVHVELNTRSKIFCSCKNDPTCKKPNTHVCPTCMGLVGALPLLNREAFNKTVLLARALDCKIPKLTHWDRKSYFYPDLPKGYQISQSDFPIGGGGKIRFAMENEIITINMNRVHLEEDAAKSIHHPNKTFIDFNRSGTALVEMVTEPELNSPEQAKALLKEVHRLVRDLGISDADMEKGQMRCDASISLRPIGSKELFPRVEIKNLNSFRAVENALKSQKEKLEDKWHAGLYPEKEETVLWDADSMTTRPMRAKETAADYRYFPEADIPIIKLSDIATEDSALEERRLRINELENLAHKGLKVEKLLHIVEPRELFWHFIDIYNLIKNKESKKIALNLWMSDVVLKNESLPFGLEEFVRLVEGVGSKSIPVSSAKDIVRACTKLGDIDVAIGKIKNILSDVDLTEVVKRVLNNHEDLAKEYLNGREKIVQVLVGLVMKETKGAFSGPVVRDAIVCDLSNRKAA